MKSFHCFVCFMLVFCLGGCRSAPSRNTDYTFTLKDSLSWHKKSVDTFVNIPYSYVPLVILPDKMQSGDVIEKKNGQATAKVEKQPDGSLLITASCDSLQLHIQYLDEQLTSVRNQNEKLQEQVKAAPSKTKWFLIGFFCGTLLISLINIILLILKRK